MSRRRLAPDLRLEGRLAFWKLGSSGYRLLWLLLPTVLLAGLGLSTSQLPGRRIAGIESQSSARTQAAGHGSRISDGSAASPASSTHDPLRHQSQLPRVHSSRPDSVELEAPGRERVLLAGLRLDHVVGVRVVSDRGAPSSEISARILSSGDIDTSGTLLIELTAGPRAQAGEYRFQLNASLGGVYAPRDISRIVVRDGNQKL